MTSDRIVDLERRLRDEAAALAPRPPAGLADDIVRAIRSAPRPRREVAPARSWLPFLAGALAVVAIAAGVVALRDPALPAGAGEVAVRPAPAEPAFVPAPPSLHAALALASPARALEREWDRVGADVAAASRVLLACLPSAPQADEAARP